MVVVQQPAEPLSALHGAVLVRGLGRWPDETVADSLMRSLGVVVLEVLA